VAIDVARRRSNGWFDPGLIVGLKEREHDDAFWKGLSQGDARELVALVEPAQTGEMNEENLDRIAEAFAAVIDAKSPFTHDHSRRMSALAVAIGMHLGLASQALVRLRRAALLHDIGKLGVPNRILDKPGKLTRAEWAIVRRHPQVTYEILDRVPLFREFAFDASCHHEKLDGTGYFRQLSGAAISQTARILVVADIVDALRAERPYRPGLPLAQVVEMLGVERGRTLCADSVDAAIDVLENRDAVATA
jgi:HD-GYP domain-containing protein (c-di-GMP phosphodiesterase class II)